MNRSMARSAAAFAALLLASMAIAPAHGQLLGDFPKTVKDGGVAAVLGYLDGGGDPNAVQGPRNLTLLHWAAFFGSLDVAKLLVERGAVVSAHSKDPDWFPLHYASFLGHSDVVVYLLDHGALIDAPTSDGVTALSGAATYNDYNGVSRESKIGVVELLLSRGADGGYALVRLVTEGRADGVSLLLDRGVSVNATARSEHPEFGVGLGETALLIAAQRGDLALANLLLARGADPELKSVRSVNIPTPLMAAVYRCDRAMIDNLLAHGASRYTTNSSGDTAAALAQQGWTSDMKPCPADIVAKLR